MRMLILELVSIVMLLMCCVVVCMVVVCLMSVLGCSFLVIVEDCEWLVMVSM